MEFFRFLSVFLLIQKFPKSCSTWMVFRRVIDFFFFIFADIIKMQREQIPEDTKMINELVARIKACDQEMLALQSQDPERRSAEWRLINQQRTQLVDKLKDLVNELIYVPLEAMGHMKQVEWKVLK